jgi:hypothetical protein
VPSLNQNGFDCVIVATWILNLEYVVYLKGVF